MARTTPEKELRRDARLIFKAALLAADPKEGIRRSVRINGGTLQAGTRSYRIADFRRIAVVGAGKASANMASEVEGLLGGITGGLINTKYGHLAKLRSIRLNECGHPLPDEAGLEGATQIPAIAAEAGPDDLLICLTLGRRLRVAAAA